MVWDYMSVAIMRAVQKTETSNPKTIVYVALMLVEEGQDTLPHWLATLEKLCNLRYIDKDPLTGVYKPTSKAQEFEKSFKVYTKLGLNLT